MVSQSPRAGAVPLQDDPRFMITRPPRPPSWRDFLPETNQTTTLSPPKRGERTKSGRGAADHLGFSDLTSAHRSRSEGNDLSRLGLSSSGSTLYLGGLTENRAATLPHLKHHKKHKNRLHRTRSQYSIEKTDLPDKEQMTLTLAETKPKEIGLRSKRPLDLRVYHDQNTRKCQEWLAGVQASKPVFSQEMGILEELSSDQDSSSSHTRSRSSKVTTQGHNSSSSDIDSVSVLGAAQKARHSPGKTKSGIPVHESHRKSKGRHSKSPDTVKVKIKVKDGHKNNISISQGTDLRSSPRASPSVSPEKEVKKSGQQQKTDTKSNEAKTENNRTRVEVLNSGNMISSVNNKNNNVKNVVKSTTGSFDSNSNSAVVISQELEVEVDLDLDDKVIDNTVEEENSPPLLKSATEAEDTSIVSEIPRVPSSSNGVSPLLDKPTMISNKTSVEEHMESSTEPPYTVVPGYVSSTIDHHDNHSDVTMGVKTTTTVTQSNTSCSQQQSSASKEHTGSTKLTSLISLSDDHHMT